MYLNISSAGWYLIGASVLFLILFAGFVLFYFVAKQKRNELLLKEQRNKNEYEQALLTSQLEIQEQTLKTISQEIHDNVGQVLSLAKLNLATITEGETGNQQKVNDAKQLVGKAISDLRDLSRSLHGDKISEIGLTVAIDNELRILKNIGQYDTEFKIIGDSYKLEQKQEIVLFRIVQESLNNIVKHSKAKLIRVQTTYQPASFILTITDDGIGFDAGALVSGETGIGLKSMQSRTALIGGTFSIHSAPGKGTTINIELKDLINTLTI